MKDSQLLGLVIVGFMVFEFATPAFASSWGWGSYIATSFTTNTVVGLKMSDVPFWSNKVAWSGNDRSIAFVLTVFTPWSETQANSFAWQVALLARSNSKFVDEIYQDPGTTNYVVACSKCVDGTAAHTLEISRITNGWSDYVDGSSIHSYTCTCLASDYLDKTVNQEPIVMEVMTTETQAHIDNAFKVSEGYSVYYEASPVGSGTWHAVPHMYAYYTNTNFACTNTNVGDTNPPTWAAMNSNGFVQDTETGTTTNLTKLSCSNQIFSPTH